MTRSAAILGIVFGATALWRACLPTSALAVDPQMAPPEVSGRTQDHQVTLPVVPLGSSPRCSLFETHERAQPMCVDSNQAANGAYEPMLELLRSGRRDREALCYVDTNLVRSLQECVILPPWTPEKIHADHMRSNLIAALAQAWREQGDFVRADDLYRYYFAGAWGKSACWVHLDEWALVRLALGEPDDAKVLADGYVACFKKLYDCDKGLRRSLMAALEFRLEIGERLEDSKGVEVAREELRALSALADERCPEGACVGTPANDGVCIEEDNPVSSQVN